MLPIRPRPATYEKLESNSSSNSNSVTVTVNVALFVKVITGRVPRSTDVQTLAPSAHAVVSLLTHSMYWRTHSTIGMGAGI